MRGKIQPGPAARRTLALAGLALASLAWMGQPAEVSGRVTMLDKEDQPGDDVGQAVLWLSGPPSQPRAPVQAEMGTSKKEFSPHVLVVPVGSTVSFPNHDPFNHNVFSLSEENPFDLGLYGRDEVRSVRFEAARAGARLLNVHAQMSALVVVRDTRGTPSPRATAPSPWARCRPAATLCTPGTSVRRS